MSRRIESVIDAAGSWTKTVLKMTCVVDRPDLFRDIGVFHTANETKKKLK